MEWILPAFEDNLNLLVIMSIAYGIYNIILKLIDKGLIHIRFGGKYNLVNSINIDHAITSRIMEIAAEYNVDKIYIVEYDKNLTEWSMRNEYSPTVPNIAKHFQNMPNQGFIKVVTDLLISNGKIIYNNLLEISDESKRDQLAYYKLNSWYSFALRGGENYSLIGSLNLCFKRENPLSNPQVASLSGKIATIQHLMDK